MNDRHLLRGLLLAAIALGFGLGSLNYSIGSFARAGPGLFPLMVSGLLGGVALVMIVQSRFEREKAPLDLRLKNIGLLLAALTGFALVSRFVNMTAGIAVMVVIASLAGTGISWKRNLKVAAGLIAMAFAFQGLLGLRLPLY